MAAKDHHPASHDDSHLQDLDDAQLETLSLCDLPLYSDEHVYDSLKEDGLSQVISTPPNTDHGEDPFEFSSEDPSASSGAKMCSAEDIIFCGRLIPYGQGVPSINGPPEARGKIGGTHKLNNKKKKKKKWRFFKWRFSLFRRHRSRSFGYHNLKFDDNRSSNSQHLPAGLDCLPLEKYRCVPDKCMDKYSFSMGRLPAQSGRVKCRWYVLMFRPARFPVGMELQDMKTRQSCRNLSSMSRSSASDAGKGNGKCGRKGNWNWGMWRLLRALSFSGSQHYGGAAIRKTL